MNRTRLTNARIVDVESGTFFPPGTDVVVENGRITAVEPVLERPDKTEVLDMGGRTLIPGLFNVHCHLHLGPKGSAGMRQIRKNLSDCLDRGITNIRDALCCDLSSSRNLANETTPGQDAPRIHQAVHVAPLGGPYSPQRTLGTRIKMKVFGLKLPDYELPHSGAVVVSPDAGTQEIRDAVDRAVERGATTIKLCDQPEHFLSYEPGAPVFSVRQLAAAAKQAEKHGMPSTMHNVTAAGFRNAVAAGITSLAHLPLDKPLTDKDIHAFLAAETMLEPTISLAFFLCYDLSGSPVAGDPEVARLNGFRKDRFDDVINEFWLPEYRRFRIGLHRRLENGSPRLAGLIDFSRPFRYYSPLITTGADNLRRIVAAGGAERISCGNDAGAVNSSPASIGLELAMLDFVLNRDGTTFSNAALLRAATINSARSLKIDRDFGSIAPGKVADIAVIDGDPFTDISVIGAPVSALYMNGRLAVNRCGLRCCPAS